MAAYQPVMHAMGEKDRTVIGPEYRLEVGDWCPDGTFVDCPCGHAVDNQHALHLNGGRLLMEAGYEEVGCGSRPLGQVMRYGGLGERARERRQQFR